eukprot:gene11270-15121_t
MKGKIKSSLLSFDVDDEEEDSGFQLKKSKESKKFKRMKQAPGIYDSGTTINSFAVETISSSLGGAYSAESLAQLKQSQKFVKPPSINEKEDINNDNHDRKKVTFAADNLEVEKEKPYSIYGVDEDLMSGEVIEYSGEDAEEMMELSERLQNNNNNNQVLNDNHNPYSNGLDQAVIQSARDVNRKLLNESKDERIYTTLKKEKREFVNDVILEDEYNDEWENEIIKRDIMKTIKFAMDKLKINTDNYERRIEQLKQESDRVKNDERILENALSNKLNRLNMIKEIRSYFSDVVGMLREKKSSIDQMMSNMILYFEEQWNNVKARRRQEQLDALYLLSQANIVDDSSIISYINTSSEIIHIDLNQREHQKTENIRNLLILLSHTPTITTNNNNNPFIQSNDIQNHELDRITIQSSSLQMNNDNKSLQNFSKNHNKNEFYVSELLDVMSGGWYVSQDHINKLMNQKESIIEDVDNEIGSIIVFIDKLKLFRQNFPKEYKEAFISLSIPELLKPLLEICISIDLYCLLLPSNPDSQFQQLSKKSIRDYDWHEPLCDFSTSDPTDPGGTGKDNQLEKTENNDTDLLPQLILMTYLPYLQKMVINIDHRSFYQSNNLYIIISELMDYDPLPEQITPLFDELMKSFKTEIDSICLPLLALKSQQ